MTANASLDEKIKSAAEIFNKYEGLIRSAIYVNLSDYSRADDIYQSLFLHLVHKPIPRYVRNTKAYLYKIIQHNIYDTVQSTDKNQKRLYEYGKCQRRGSEIRKPQDVLIQQEEIEKIFMLAKNLLPSPERNALIQRYRYGLDVAEAAREMNVNKRSFSRYISVALRKIRSFVNDEQASKYKH